MLRNAIVLGTLLMATCLAVNLTKSTSAQAFQPKQDRQWAYRTVQRSGPLQEHELNKMGAEGWEVAEVIAISEHRIHYIFKR